MEYSDKHTWIRTGRGEEVPTGTTWDTVDDAVAAVLIVVVGMLGAITIWTHVKIGQFDVL